MEKSEKIKAVIWDMGGVLIRTEDPKPRAQLAASLGLSVRELAARVFDCEAAQLATIGKKTADAIWDDIRRDLKMSDEEVLEFQKQFFKGDSVDYDLLRYIDGLRPGCKTALLSNAWTGAREFIDQRYGILRYFDETLFSAEVAIAKPDPTIYNLMLERLGVSAGEAIFVDDFEENVTGANEVGIHGVRFVSARQAREDINRLLQG